MTYRNAILWWHTTKQHIFSRVKRVVSQRELSWHDYVAIFIFALCLGATIKILVRDTLTIGYNDYTLPHDTVLIDFNHLESTLITQNGLTSGATPAPTGETCSESEGL